MAKSNVFARIREEVIRLVALIPEGRFTTYGSIALHMNCNPRHVAKTLSGLSAEESARLPWHRVVAAEGRISRSMEPELAERQRKLLEKEGMKVNARGFIQESDDHFHVVGIRREIRWDEN
ncbi:MGMT family protein [Luteolibacter sp. GHJ8]|uniref:MGMT family protein n=1 Tax=Luteolibacter rhizosphaerae TaxID=2989719 RepID=A0ABT3FXP5_9BACT|nr:MGMT family protein [Luteolibacter rhizosphaerae]MCW1912349.1 MGMT family protein [Luteolibacter rhizosphaerae]